MDINEDIQGDDGPLLVVIRQGMPFKQYFLALAGLLIISLVISSILVHHYLDGSISWDVLGTLLFSVVFFIAASYGIYTFLYLFQLPAELLFYEDKIILRRTEGNKSTINEIMLNDSTEMDLYGYHHFIEGLVPVPYCLTVKSSQRLTISMFRGWDVEGLHSILGAIVPLIKHNKVRVGVELNEFLATYPGSIKVERMLQQSSEH